MISNQEINTLLSTAIYQDNAQTPINKELFAQNTDDSTNEFLFFIKPELTLQDDKIDFKSISNLISDKIKEFNLSIKNIRFVNAAYLKKHQIINQHYGVIDQISGNCRKYVNQEAKDKFKEIYNDDFDTANVYGSKEFLKEYKFLTPTGLSFAWQNSVLKKLAGGTYSQKHTFDGNTVYIINGFHPRQLEYFTSPGRAIIVMTLTGDTSWTKARSEFIGKTNPLDSVDGCIRKELALNKEKFGLVNIDSTWNGVHLSAGPIEGLIELMRYNSDFENNICQTPLNYKLGQQLISEFGADKTNAILSNPIVKYEGKMQSVFDLSEEMNTDECINALHKVEFK